MGATKKVFLSTLLALCIVGQSWLPLYAGTSLPGAGSSTVMEQENTETGLETGALGEGAPPTTSSVEPGGEDAAAGGTQTAQTEPDAAHQAPAQSETGAQKGAARTANAPADTGDTVPLSTAAELLAILNARFVDPGKTYVLQNDITIQGADLDKSICESIGSGDYTIGTFQSNFDGNGKTIKVEVAPGEASRSLFARLNGVSYAPGATSVRYETWVRDLTVHYTGNVENNGFAVSTRGVALSNITVLLQDDSGTLHDIVPGAPDASSLTQVAGFASSLGDHIPGDDTYYTTAKNITVKAGTIGSPLGTQEQEAIVRLRSVAGFAGIIEEHMCVEDIAIDAQYIRAVADNSNAYDYGAVSGFADKISVDGLGYVRNVHITVAHDMLYQNVKASSMGFYYDGVYGFFKEGSTLCDSSLVVGGSMVSETGTLGGDTLAQDGGAHVALIGSTHWSDRGKNMSTPQFANLSVTVEQSVKSLGRGDSIVTLGLLRMSNAPYRAQGNSIVVKGDVVAQRSGAQLAAAGDGTRTESSIFFGYNMANLTDDSIYIGGNLVAENDRTSGVGTAAIQGHTPGGGNFTNNRVTVAQDVRVATANGTASFNGFYNYLRGRRPTDNSDLLMSGNTASYLGNVTVQSGGVGTSIGATAYGFTSDGGKDGNGDPYYARNLQNNMVYIAGDFTVTGERFAYASGFGNAFTNLSSTAGNIVRIGGKLSATANDTASAINPEAAPEDQVTGECVATGFAMATNASTQGNAVYVGQGVQANTAAPAPAENAPTAASFIVSIDANAIVTENTVLGRPGKNQPGDTQNYYELFALSVDGAADVEGNFYTSLSGGQRVANLLTHNKGTGAFTAGTGKQPSLLVGNSTDYAQGETYLLANDCGTLAFAGGAAADVQFDDASGTLHTPAAVSNVATTVQKDGKTAVMDLPGIGHPYPAGTISGKVFVDKNNNGLYDAGDVALPGATIEVKYVDEAVRTIQADSEGNYTLPVPLLNCHAENEYTLTVACDETTCKPSSHPNNHFGLGGLLSETMGWSTHYEYNALFVQNDPIDNSSSTASSSVPTSSKPPVSSAPPASSGSVNGARSTSVSSGNQPPVGGGTAPAAPASSAAPRRPAATSRRTASSVPVSSSAASVVSSAPSAVPASSEVEAPSVSSSTAPATTALGDGNTPRTDPTRSQSWALLNLILAIVSLLLGILLLTGVFTKGKEGQTGKRGLVWRILAMVAGLLSPAAFLLTSNLSATMTFVDKWTILMVLVIVVQLGLSLLMWREYRTFDPDDTDDAYPV